MGRSVDRLQYWDASARKLMLDLRYELIEGVTQQFGRIFRVQSMFSINECSHAPQFLGLSDHVKRHGRLAGRFGSENFNNTAPGDTAHTQCEIYPYGTGGD